MQHSQITPANKARRALWQAAYLLLFRWTPRPLHGWRCFVLRLFGSKIGARTRVYQSAKIWAPWNLTIHDGACLGDDVDCYNVAHVTLERDAVVSQYSFLCTASHDYEDDEHPLIVAPIHIGEKAWITADVFVAPGVTVGDGAVVSARSSVFDDIEPWVVARGNPAKPVKPRVIRAAQT